MPCLRMADAWGSAWGKHKNYGAFQVVTMTTGFCDVCTESASEKSQPEALLVLIRLMCWEGGLCVVLHVDAFCKRVSCIFLFKKFLIK